MEHDISHYTPWHTAGIRHLALIRAALPLPSTEFTILEASHRASEIFWHAADVLSTSYGNLVTDEWMLTVVIVSAGNAIKPLHLVKTLSVISIVEAVHTDKSRVALRIVRTLRAELTLGLDASEGVPIAAAGEARVVVLAPLSDDFLSSAHAHLRVAVPLHRWADVELVGTTGHIHDILGSHVLIFAEKKVVDHSIDVDTQRDVVVSIVVNDLGRDVRAINIRANLHRRNCESSGN